MTFERFIYLLGAWTFSGGIAWAAFAVVDFIERMGARR